MENLNLENMMGMIKQLSSGLKEQSEGVKQQLEHLVAEGSAGGGMVVIQINGHYHVKSIDIQDSLLNKEDKVLLQESIIAAFYNAVSNMKELIKKNLKDKTAGLDLDLGGLF